MKVYSVASTAPNLVRMLRIKPFNPTLFPSYVNCKLVKD